VIEIAIDPSRCTKDGLCAIVCPSRIIVHREKVKIPEIVGEERCISCGHCVAICSSTAISHSAYPPGTISPIQFEKMPSPDQVIELLRTRRSIREFRDKPLEKETIEKITTGARLAPSGHNSQSTEFLVVLDRAVLSQVSAVTIEYLKFEVGRLNNRFFRTLVSLADRELVETGLKEIPVFDRMIRAFEAGADPILWGAPALLVFHARRSVGMAEINAHLALQNASLVAHSMGVGHFYTGWIVAACRVLGSRAWNRRIPDLIGVPPENKIHGALALGYPVPRYKNWIERKPARIQWV
jgi:nitroreductase/NAD-dependent dihydropyrimidine dehydrogenase PreA subunit